MTVIDALRACLPHTAKDATLPTLEGVRLWNGRAYATDRYTLAISEYEFDEVDHDVFVSVENVKRIISAGSDVARVENGQIVLVNGATFLVPEMSNVGDYPPLDNLVEKWKAGEASQVSFTARFLDRFAAKHFPYQNARDRRNHTVTFEMGETDTKPVRVTIPDFPWFVALVVPRKTEA